MKDTRAVARALLIGVLLYAGHGWAATPDINVDKAQLRAERMGFCESPGVSDTAPHAAWWAGSALWKIEALTTVPAGDRPAFSLANPFYFEAAVLLPGRSDWLWHLPNRQARGTGWPGDMAVFIADRTLTPGDIITVCISTKMSVGFRANLLPEIKLRAATLSRIRLASIAEGTLMAMTLSALGLSLIMRNLTFVIFAGGIAMSLLYLLASNGTLLDIPGGIPLSKEFHIQRLSGITATMLIGWGLARFIEYKERHPGLWQVVRVLMAAMGVLLLLSVVPAPSRYLSLSAYSNLIMVAIITLLLGSAVQGLLQRHRPSIVLLSSWGPVMLVAIWLGATANLDSVWSTAGRWLFPVSLIYACSLLFTELARRLSEVRAQRDVERLRAQTDQLTGAITRDELDRRLKRLHDLATAGGSGYSVLFVDFDHFKNVNDSYGHATGDAALIAALERLVLALRSKDSVGRYGGEEFVVLLADLDTKASCEIAERIRADIENGGQAITEGLPPLTISIGVASFKPAQEDTASAVIKRADAALYRAKEQGRNCVAVAD